MKIRRFQLKDQQMTVHAGTVLKVLGGSYLSVLDLLTRESIQNTLDAACSNDTFVNFNFEIVKYSSFSDLIKRLAFLRQSDNDLLFERICQRIKENDPVVITLSDTGTTGLTGPVRRDDKSWNSYSGRRNFENLVFQLGQNHGAVGAGGSYGFGKSIYYHLSSAGLIFYYTRTKEGERLIFNMISVEESRNSKGSTGIAWWGETYRYNDIEFSAPIEDSEVIREILGSLKLSDKRYRESETGTMIGIIAPKLVNLISGDNYLDNEEERLLHIEEKISLLCELFKKSTLRWYWPRMVETDVVRVAGSIKPLRVYVNSSEIKLPVEYRAMGKLLKVAEKSNQGEHLSGEGRIQIERIFHPFGNVLVGTLAFELLDNYVERSHLNRIMMMRNPRMVVFEANVPSKLSVSFAAVFLVNSDQKIWANSQKKMPQRFLDDAFKECESATHSEWNYQDLKEDKKWFKSYVKSAKEKTVKAIQNAIIPKDEVIGERRYSDLSKVMGKLLMSQDGTALSTVATSPSRGNTSSVRSLSKPRLEILNKQFSNDNTVSFVIGLFIPRNEIFRVGLVAIGGTEKLDKEKWDKSIGGRFPFILQDLNKLSELEIIAKDNWYFSIKKTSESDQIVIGCRIKIVESDAMFGLELRKN